MGQGTHVETQCDKAYTEETDKHLWIGEAIPVIVKKAAKRSGKDEEGQAGPRRCCRRRPPETLAQHDASPCSLKNGDPAWVGNDVDWLAICWAMGRASSTGMAPCAMRSASVGPSTGSKTSARATLSELRPGSPSASRNTRTYPNGWKVDPLKESAPIAKSIPSTGWSLSQSTNTATEERNKYLIVRIARAEAAQQGP